MTTKRPRIDHHAFYDCQGLESITLPASVTDIAYGAFADIFRDQPVALKAPAGSYTEAFVKAYSERRADRLAFQALDT